ncbi:MAG: phosphoribosyltransferase family protein [Acidimicrobiales bacterium]
MTPAELTEAQRRLARHFPCVDNHPDVAGVLRQAHLLCLLGPALGAPYANSGVTVVLAPEARGPIVGSLVALELQVGLMLARKEAQNHPGADVRVLSAPTWRGHCETFQARTFDLSPEDRVLVVDDWITTGNSIRAAIEIVTRANATYLGAAVLVDKSDAATLAELAVHALVPFNSIGP